MMGGAPTLAIVLGVLQQGRLDVGAALPLPGSSGYGALQLLRESGRQRALLSLFDNDDLRRAAASSCWRVPQERPLLTACTSTCVQHCFRSCHTESVVSEKAALPGSAAYAQYAR